MRSFRLIFGLCGAFVLLITLLIKTGTLHIGEPTPPSPEQMTEYRFEALSPLLERFKEKCRRYPLTEEGLKALYEKPKNIDCPNYEKTFEITLYPYFVLDGWKNPFIYTSDGKNYRIEASRSLSKTSR